MFFSLPPQLISEQNENIIKTLGEFKGWTIMFRVILMDLAELVSLGSFLVMVAFVAKAAGA